MTPPTTFKARLRERIAAHGTSLCVGADPATTALPPFFASELAAKGAAAFLTEYSCALIDASAGVVPAIKFQSAFYEAHGSDGFGVLARMLGRARSKGLLTILDAKRGDISSTMAAYGQMAFGFMGADALTVSPYLGLDVIEPLVPWLAAGHGAYVVWVSSNPGGALIQEPLAASLLQALIDAFARAGVSDALGLVLGATRVGELPLALVNRAADAGALLMPGVGAQGGTVTPLIAALVQRTGTVLVPQSRGVGSFPPAARSWATAADGWAAAIRLAAAGLAVVPPAKAGG